MHLQNLFSAADIRGSNRYLTVKTAGTQDRRIQDIHTVGGCHDNDTRRMVTRYGMSDHIGVICYDDDDDEVFIGKDLAHAKAHSEKISGEIDKEVKSIIDDCYTKAKDIILQHEDVLHSCAQLLLEKEKITREEFESLFQPKPDSFLNTEI